MTPAHVIDGTNDFKSGETFVTTSPAYTSYVTYDASTVYFGMSGADVGANSASKWVLIYVDGNPAVAGTTTGLDYNCGGGCASQKPLLPFNAGFHIRWKTDGSYTNLQKATGDTWSDGGPITTFAHQGTFFEISIPRSVLGNPSRLKVHMFMLIEQAGAEWTYAGTPAGAFTDGKAANASPGGAKKYLDLDLADLATAPNAFPVKP